MELGFVYGADGDAHTETWLHSSWRRGCREPAGENGHRGTKCTNIDIKAEEITIVVYKPEPVESQPG